MNDRSAENKVDDFVGNEVNARLHQPRKHPHQVEIDDGLASVWLSAEDAMALRDWLNKVLP